MKFCLPKQYQPFFLSRFVILLSSCLVLISSLFQVPFSKAYICKTWMVCDTRSKDRLLADTAWAKSGITLVRDICYETIPGFLPRAAVEELVGPKFKDSTYNEVMSCMPQDWKDVIDTEIAPPERHNSCFKIPVQPKRESKTFGDLKAKDFYTLLTHLDVDISNQRFRIFSDDKFGKTKWHLVFHSLFTRDDLQLHDHLQSESI